MTRSETLIRLYVHPAPRGQCRGCGADIEWHDTLTGRRMPMNASAVPRRSEHEADTHRLIGFYDPADSHFASCPQSAEFSRR